MLIGNIVLKACSRINTQLELLINRASETPVIIPGVFTLGVPKRIVDMLSGLIAS
jgi:hypothetical protein